MRRIARPCHFSLPAYMQFLRQRSPERVVGVEKILMPKDNVSDIDIVLQSFALQQEPK